ncbi:MAG: von Willebrand factor type A domain-containing protein, partial [Luteolibacter sp.]
ALLKDAETTSNSPDAEWKLSTEKRAALAPHLGPVPVIIPFRENRIRRASFRAAFGIAAVFLVTLFTTRFFIFTDMMQPEAAMEVSHSYAHKSVVDKGSRLDDLRKDIREQEDKVEERRKILTTISRTKDINYRGEEISGERPTEMRAKQAESDALERMIDTQDLAGAERDLGRESSRLENMKMKLKSVEVSESLVSEKKEVATAKPKPTSRVSRQLSAAPASAPASVEKMPFSKENQRKIIAGNKVGSTSIPVPEIETAESSSEFGDGSDFGKGWGGEDAGGGGGAGSGGSSSFAEKDKTLAMKGRSSDSLGNNYFKRLKGDSIPGIPETNEDGNGIVTSGGIVTGGLRPGDEAITRNNIDAILNNPGQDKQGEDVSFDDGVVLEDISGAPVVYGREGKGASADDWFVKSAKDRKDNLQAAIGGGETRDIIPSLPGMPIPQTDRMKPPSPDSPLPKVRSGSGAVIDEKLTEVEEKLKEGMEEEKELMNLDLKQGAEKRNLEEMSEDLARQESDFADKKQIERFAATLHNIQDEDDDEVAGLATVENDTKKPDMSHNLDTTPQDGSREIETAQQQPRSGAQMEPGQLEDAEDSDKIPDLAELPAILPLKISELRKGLDDLGELVPESGSELEDHNSPSGSTFSDNLDSASAAGQIAKAKARGKLGRAGQENGQIAADKAARIPDNEVAMPPSRTSTPSESDATKSKGGFVYEINSGYSSQYLFRGADLGGDLTENDEVPLLGDIPMVGRLFQSNSPNDIPAIQEAMSELRKQMEDPAINDSKKQSQFRFWNALQGKLTELSKSKPVDLADLSQEIPAEQEPFSTFSLNISDASFQVASSAIEKGERPDPASIKPEQFYNGVSYDDPAPSSGEPVAAAIGQLAHPIIPGRNLVRMSVRTASTGRAATQPLVLTLLVDQSGSMARADRRAAMNTALTQLATLMQPDDRITVIGFSRTPSLLADSISGDDAAQLPDIINQSSSEGGTNIEQALKLAENLALRHKVDGAQNRIVLFTDGAANLGNADPELLAERVKELRQQDLAFDIAGIGTDDINDRLLSELSRHGNGRYYLVGENTAGNLAKKLAGAFRPAAENVKIQVKFNPQRVGNYKLIGFEKDRLKTEDFRNDSVDAAELAADESGTALYQVEPLPNGSGEIGELYVRFRDTATGEMVERSWTIPYESQAPAIDRSRPQMQLAALSLLAAQKLQPGPLADAINFRDLAPTIAAVKQAYAHSPQAQQMITLINALK